MKVISLQRLKRKIQEQYLAINAEKTKPKEEILTDYLNTINLGKGNLGVETASKYYFGKSAKNLTLSECAVLAGITKNPTYLNPVDYPEANDARRKLILKKMYQLNYISAKEYQQASEDNVYAKIKSHTAKGKTKILYIPILQMRLLPRLSLIFRNKRDIRNRRLTSLFIAVA